MVTASKQLSGSLILLLTAGAVFSASGEAASGQSAGSAATPSLAEQTSAALLDQLRCRDTPETSRAINAMLKNHLIRYVENESGVYLFAPTVPLKFLDLRIAYISGFDYFGFRGAPPSTMAGGAPPVFLEVRVVAPVEELRRRGVSAGLVETEGPGLRPRLEFTADGNGSYLAPPSREVMSSVQCVG